MQQINFTTNVDRGENTKILFIMEETKKRNLDFSEGTVKVL